VSARALVVGLGAMGSAAAYQLARRGVRVVGIDAYSPPHSHGSHCGETRITRKAIGEGEMYVPLVLRAYEIWREVEEATGERLLDVVGGLWISSPRRRVEIHVADFYARTLAAARRFGIAHEILDAGEIRSRFPAFGVRDDETGYFEPDAGILYPEACVRAQLALAANHGAELRTGERAVRIVQSGNEVTVVTDRDEYTASRAIVCAGAGAGNLLPPEIAGLLTVTRQMLHWFEADGLEDLPVWIWELQERDHAIYGFPARGGRIKVATETFSREIPASELHASLIAPHVRGVGGRCLASVPCLYTTTPDFHFLIDRHPAMDRVIVASPCSGHGFKHSAAIGEALAQLIVDGRAALDLSPFALGRFIAAGSPRP
jgi:sarcosine oxidase